VHTDNYTSWRDEEELVDHEPEEELASFSPMEEGISADGDELSAHKDGQSIISANTNVLPVKSTEDCNVPSRRRWQMFFRQGVVSGASERGNPKPGSPVGG
jgi:hypothetical protein